MLPDYRLRLYLTALCAFLAPALSDPGTPTYSHLVPYASQYSSGAFLSPKGSTDAFTEGSYLNISWEATAFSSYNLYLIRGQDFPQSISLQENYYIPWYNWQVNGYNNLTKPFLLRVVNANGTQQAQDDGGFESEQFWILPTSTAGSTQSTSSVSSVSLHSATAAATGKSSATSTPLKTSAAGGGGGLSASADVGIGVGVGVGVTALLLVGAFLIWRRSQKKKQQHNAAMSPSQYQDQHPSQYAYGGAGPPMAFHQGPSSGYASETGSMAHGSSYAKWGSPGTQSPVPYARSPGSYAHEAPASGGVFEMDNRNDEVHELFGGSSPQDATKSARRLPIQPWSGRSPDDT